MLEDIALNEFESIDNGAIEKRDGVTIDLAKSIHSLFIRKKYSAGIILFRTLLIHIAYDLGYHGDKNKSYYFEEVINFIDKKLNVGSNIEWDRFKELKQYSNKMSHDPEIFNESKVDKYMALEYGSGIKGLLEQNG